MRVIVMLLARLRVENTKTTAVARRTRVENISILMRMEAVLSLVFCLCFGDKL